MGSRDGTIVVTRGSHPTGRADGRATSSSRRGLSRAVSRPRILARKSDPLGQFYVYRVLFSATAVHIERVCSLW